MSALTAPEIIIRPVVSEKSIDESGRGKYTFAVHKDANKIQIKSAIEELYAKEASASLGAAEQILGRRISSTGPPDIKEPQGRHGA